jgi:hypothetical protein
VHRLWGLRAGLTGLRDFCAGRPARKVEALHGTKRELRPGRQVHTRRVRQAQRNEVGAQEKPNHSPSPRSLSEARSVCPTSPMRAHNPDRFFPSRPEATTTIPGFRRPPNWTTKSASGSVKSIDRRGNCRRSQPNPKLFRRQVLLMRSVLVLAHAYGRCWARPSYNSVDAPGWYLSTLAAAYGSQRRGTEDLSRTPSCCSLTPVVSRRMFI